MAADPELQAYVRQTRDHYRRRDVAEAYHAGMSNRLPDRILTRFERRAIARALADLPGRHWPVIADIPAGTGKLQSLLTAHSDTYIALDISTAMLQFVTAPNRVLANAAHLPLRSTAPDVVVCLRLLHRVPTAVFGEIVSELIASSGVGCVLSYAGPPRSPRAHAMLRRVLRRPFYPRHAHDPVEVARVAAQAGGHVISDRSVSFGVTSERVAAILRAR